MPGPESRIVRGLEGQVIHVKLATWKPLHGALIRGSEEGNGHHRRLIDSQPDRVLCSRCCIVTSGGQRHNTIGTMQITQEDKNRQSEVYSQNTCFTRPQF
eukprot:4673034-Amphidinium_carterae.1